MAFVIVSRRDYKKKAPEWKLCRLGQQGTNDFLAEIMARLSVELLNDFSTVGRYIIEVNQNVDSGP